MAEWDADFEIDAKLALKLVRAQFPEFEGVRADKLGAGWDNVAFHVDDRAVFRFPRRAFAVPFLEREARWLPRLAQRLSMPIPVPRWIGEPAEEFDRIFVGYEFLPGTTMCSANIPRAERGNIAATMGGFCRELHALDMSRFGEPPGDDIRRRDLERRMNLIERTLSNLRSRGVVRDGKILDLARHVRSRTSDDGQDRWVHGDLYARHVLIHDDAVSGVVDWGDTHFGDRAIDLSIAWTAFDSEGRLEFFARYGEVPDSVRYRAALRAIHYALTLLDYGHDIGDQALVTESDQALTELLAAEF